MHVHNNKRVFKELNRPVQNKFFTTCNSCRTAILWFHVKQYSISITKISGNYFSGANNLCFCMIREFGSPTF